SDLVLEMPELLMVPAEYEPAEHRREPRKFYLGALVDLDRHERPFPWHEIDERRFLIACSFGSQPDLGRDLLCKFYGTLLEAIAQHPDWQLVLSTGNIVDPATVARPENAWVGPWIPQIQILRRAGAMISHAGIGTVRECISLG